MLDRIGIFKRISRSAHLSCLILKKKSIQIRFLLWMLSFLLFAPYGNITNLMTLTKCSGKFLNFMVAIFGKMLHNRQGVPYMAKFKQ